MSGSSSKIATCALLVAAVCGILTWYHWAVTYVDRSSPSVRQYQLNTYLNAESLHQSRNQFDGNSTRNLFPMDGVFEDDDRTIEQFQMMTDYGDGNLTARRKIKASY